MKKDDLPEAIKERIEAELLSGEELLWVGNPEVLRLMQRPLRKTMPLLVAIVGLELFALIASLVMTGTVFAPILLVAWLLAFIFTVAIGDIWQRYWSARNTLYAITNQRAIILEGADATSYGADSLQQIKRRTGKNGRGDLIFKTSHIERFSAGVYAPSRLQERIEEGFFGIDAPEHVEILMMKSFMLDEKPISTKQLEDNLEANFQEEEKASQATRHV